MAKTLDQLPSLPQPLQGTDIILVKTIIDAVPLDFQITVDTFLQNYLQVSEVGTEVNDLIRLIDDGDGNAGLPAVSGKLLTNITIPEATGVQKGSVFLSDATNSGNDVSTGYAATSKAVRDVSVASVQKAGDIMSGLLNFVNNNGVTINNSGGTAINGLKITVGNDLEIGQTGTTAVNTKIITGTSFKVQDSAGTDVFSFNTDGTTSGIVASGVDFTPYDFVTATDCQAAIQQVADAALTGGGGDIDGPINFGNNLGITTRNAADTANIPTIYMDNTDSIILGAVGANPVNDIVVRKAGKLSLRDNTDTEIFSWNADGSSTGMKSADVSFTPTGTISATSVEAAINELDSKKLSNVGDVVLDNNVSFASKQIDTTQINLVKLGVDDEVLIGQSNCNAVNVQTSGEFTIKDSAGVEIFKVDQTGVVSGVDAAEVTFTPYGTISSSNVNGALQELSDEKIGASGGTLTGSLTLANNIPLVGTYTNTANINLFNLDASNNFNLGQLGYSGQMIAHVGTGSFEVHNELGQKIFGVANSGFSGVNSRDLPHTPSGNIVATNVEDAIEELDTEKLSTTGVAADSSKLGGIAAASYAQLTDLYTHPTHAGDDINIDTGPLSGATVISDLDFNITTDTLGHVTDANAVIATRNITAADVSAGGLSTTNTWTGSNTFNSTVNFRGAVDLADNDILRFGTGDDVEMYFSGTDFLIDVNNGEDIIIRDGNSSNANRFTFDVDNGNFTATGNITAYSDKRVKANEEVIDHALDKVSKISGYTFDRIDITVPRQTGVIAQEVQEVLPEAVTVDANGNLSVAYGNMVGLLIESIKELKQEVEDLKGKIKE